MGKMKIDNPLFRIMGKLGDMLLLNLLFILTCIPVLTVGMAVTAMYKVMLKRARGTDGYIFRDYIRACREEWKKSTMIWILLLAAGAVLLFDILYIGRKWSVLGIGVGCLIVLWCMVFIYVFPLQAQFENTLKNTLKNALYLAVRFFPYTLVLLAVFALPVICFVAGGLLLGLVGPIYLTVGFALSVRCSAALFTKIFEQYLLLGEE